MTSSPCFTPNPCSARRRALKPEPTPTACFTPARAQSAASSSRTCGPPAHWPLLTTSETACTSSSPKVRRLWGTFTHAAYHCLNPQTPFVLRISDGQERHAPRPLPHL